MERVEQIQGAGDHVHAALAQPQRRLHLLVQAVGSRHRPALQSSLPLSRSAFSQEGSQAAVGRGRVLSHESREAAHPLRPSDSHTEARGGRAVVDRVARLRARREQPHESHPVRALEALRAHGLVREQSVSLPGAAEAPRDHAAGAGSTNDSQRVRAVAVSLPGGSRTFRRALRRHPRVRRLARGAATSGASICDRWSRVSPTRASPSSSSRPSPAPTRADWVEQLEKEKLMDRVVRLDSDEAAGECHAARAALYEKIIRYLRECFELEQQQGNTAPSERT
ncbi:unnamed protein product [Trichogramma brassicae]|uniref:Uncharacterized protein n=1 Tax=Trichogramma brassicae TaxID=86971 RepID=A0A6H5J4S2_9HYME|nr:unnamed protein product [Trichogramma brassicae]